MNHGGGEPSLASLTERSAEMKRALVDFALSPRFERHLERFKPEAADPCRELNNGDAVGVIDRFALQHRLRKVLRKPGFIWAEHGEDLLRRRKPWYYEHEPRPGISVIGTRLSELLRQ